MERTVFIFENGNKLEVTKEGFTLWDTFEGRWVLDGSCLEDDNTVRVASRIKVKKGKAFNKEIPSLYPEEKEVKK